MKSNTIQLKTAEKYLGDSCPNCCSMKNNCCCYFVCKIFKESGNASLFYNGKMVTYCPNAIKWCRANLAEIPIYLAMPSDIIYFDWNLNGDPDHIGFVDHKISDQQIATLEGNTTSKGIVAKRVRPVKYVLAVFRPSFVPTSYSVTEALAIDGNFGYNSIAMLQKALGIKVDGILGKQTVKALQKRVGATQDGSWGTKTSKAVQKMIGATQDGWFGENSTKALQKWINKQCGFTSSAETKPVVKEKESYKGTYPNIVSEVVTIVKNTDKIVDKAKDLAWAKGTKESKYSYNGGSPTSKFKKALDKIYPNRKSWGAAPRVGAACDVFTGTVIGSTGLVNDYPRGLNEQINYKNNDVFERLVYTNVTPYSVSKDGDVVMYYKNEKGTSKHTLIRGNGVIYEAQLKLTYGHVNTSAKTKLDVKRPLVIILRAKDTKIKTTKNYLYFGDKGEEVKNLQRYLNWYFSDDKKYVNLDIDGDFGTKTEEAVKAFQKAQGLDIDGSVGKKTLASMKAYKK